MSETFRHRPDILELLHRATHEIVALKARAEEAERRTELAVRASDERVKAVMRQALSVATAARAELEEMEGRIDRAERQIAAERDRADAADRRAAEAADTAQRAQEHLRLIEVRVEAMQRQAIKDTEAAESRAQVAEEYLERVRHALGIPSRTFELRESTADRGGSLLDSVH